jgi:hypothetical protein
MPGEDLRMGEARVGGIRGVDMRGRPSCACGGGDDKNGAKGRKCMHTAMPSSLRALAPMDSLDSRHSSSAGPGTTTDWRECRASSEHSDGPTKSVQEQLGKLLLLRAHHLRL